VGGKAPYPPTLEVFGKLFDQQRAVVLHQLLLESGVALGVLLLLSVFLGWLMAGRGLRARSARAPASSFSSSMTKKRSARWAGGTACRPAWDWSTSASAPNQALRIVALANRMSGPHQSSCKPFRSLFQNP